MPVVLVERVVSRFRRRLARSLRSAACLIDGGHHWSLGGFCKRC